MRSSLVLVMLAIGVATVIGQAPEAGTATDPILGTWTLNLERSTFRPGPGPAPGTISVRRYSLRPDGFMVTVFAAIDPQGTPSFLQAVWKYDGKDYPLYASDSLIDFAVTGLMPGTMAYKAKDAYSTELAPKHSTGEPSFKGIRRRVVSMDGRTLVDISRGTNARGQQVDNVLIFDRCTGPCFELGVLP